MWPWTRHRHVWKVAMATYSAPLTEEVWPPLFGQDRARAAMGQTTVLLLCTLCPATREHSLLGKAVEESDLARLEQMFKL